MLFTSLAFLGLLPLILVVAWAAPTNRLRKLGLLAASYAFYASWDWRFLGLILFSTGLDYQVGLHLGREPLPGRRRLWLGASLAGNLGLLGLFKYYGFFLESLGPLLAWLGLDPAALRLDLVLPVGISFYTFQTLSYTLDVYRRDLAPCDSPLDFALFVAFFLQLVAGPIVRAREFLPQLDRFPDPGRTRWRLVVTLFVIGFFKKACLADNLAPWIDQVYAAPHAVGTGASWLAVAAFFVQIYADFSGYSDMALALAAACGYRLCDNFGPAFLATDPLVFWRSWHMSLTRWLHDYVFQTLGGVRGRPAAVAARILGVFTLVGLWHGAGWTFLAWGALHGVVVVAHMVWREWARPRLGCPPLPAPVAWALTMAALAPLGHFFRAETIGDAWTLLVAMVGGGGSGRIDLPPTLWGILLAFLVAHAILARTPWPDAIRRLPRILFLALLGGAIELCLVLQAPVAEAHIYFQF